MHFGYSLAVECTSVVHVLEYVCIRISQNRFLSPTGGELEMKKPRVELKQSDYRMF